MQNSSLRYLIIVLLALFEQAYSNCNYLSTETIILSLSYPEQKIDVELGSEILTFKENIGYGLWVKYQPFISVSDTSQSEINPAPSGYFVYLLQQRETNFNLLTFYISISDQTQTLTHNVFYAFKETSGTLVFNFEYNKYEGEWILFYFYINFLSESTMIGFFQMEEKTTTKTQIVNDIPVLFKEIRHQIGGKYEITNQLGDNLSLSQFVGRLSTIFSYGQVNLFQDLEAFLLDCAIQSECEESTYILSNSNQAFLGQSYLFDITNVFEYPIYVIKGWLKLQLFEKSPLDTVIFRVTINQDYQDDIQIGDKDIYLQYHQNSIPELNGFSITTYSYNFPTSNKYTSTDIDVISDFEEQYLDLLIKWHYIQYEIGTNNNLGEPIFQIYFPSLIIKQKIFRWSNQIKHFTGTIMYYYIGGDKQSKNYLKGYISDMQLISYCKTPIITLSPNCHYSCLTCDGPNSNNCLSCPLNSQRLQSVTQKICACQQKYVDIANEPICKPVQEIFPQMKEVELELQCDSQGYDVCTEEKRECSFGYFMYEEHCLQCPGYSSLNTKSVILCSNCLFQPKEFEWKLTCYQDTFTYKNDKDFLYNTIKRMDRNIEFYQIIKNGNGDQELFLQKGFSDYGSCKQGYFYRDNQCFPCDNGCGTCQNQSICEICYSGYVLTREFSCTQCPGCSDCIINQEKLLCMTCVTGTYLSNGVCIPCGQNCSSCNSNGSCLYCDDPSKYFQTFDGHNCQPCNIASCIYCYQYYLKDGITHTTIDINYEILESSQEQYFIGCALCQANLYYNQITFNCQEKPPTSSITNDCTFGLIINSSGDTECLISTTSKTSMQNTDCLFISNCVQCIKNYSKAITFCIICADGYYSSILTGQCLKCESDCKTCIQQSQLQQDYWKWKIKAYYKYVFNQDNSHPFESYAVDTFQSNFEVVCTSCPFGYILEEHKCIKNCDSECIKCEIIKGVATCIQCSETPQGFLKSKDSNGKCLACPSNCGACLERTDAEIIELNPYFILSPTNLKYTRICYEGFNFDSYERKKYFHNQQLKTIIFCETYNKCYYQVILAYNIYCSQKHFKSIADNLSGEAQYAFKIKNLYISDLFLEDHQSNVETSGLFQYLNEKVISEVILEYTLIQNQGETCIIPSESLLYSKIQQNVFTVSTFNLKLIGQSYPTIVIIKDQFTLSNFTTISINNIQFDIIVSSWDYQSTSIRLENTKSLVIQDCDFSTNNPKREIVFKIISINDQPYSLSIINLTIRNVKFIHSHIFNLKSFSRLRVQNFKITNSYFIASSLFFLDGDFYFDLLLKSINIFNSTFDGGFLIFYSSDGVISFENLLIQEIKLEAVNIIKDSSLMLIKSAKALKLQGLIILDTIISQSSYFFISSTFELQDLYINNTNISSSKLFSNDLNQTNYDRDVSIINCTIENVYYDNEQAIIQLISLEKKFALNVSIKQFKLTKSVITVKVQYNYIYYYQSIIYIECQTCILEDVEIQRGHGMPEISILKSQTLSLNRIKFTQLALFRSKTLHQSLDCMLNYAYDDMYFYLYIGLYHTITINNLELSDSITYNNPFIIVEAYNLREKIQNESINIQNSKFESNMLIITKSNTISSIISLISEQNCKINIDSVFFQNNHLNQYVQDLSRQSASTLLFQLQQGDVYISNTVFKQNLVTNSTDSILYLKSINVLFHKNQFSNNNILQFQTLAKNLLLFENQKYNEGMSLLQTFPINSKGGNGLIIANIIQIDKTSVNNSFSLFGGGFYIVAQVTGTIHIQNSIFLNTFTSLSSSSYSTGGCLYIDAQLSELHLHIYSTTIENSISRIQGGGIYILPSQREKYVNLQNLTVINCFSIQFGFFSYILSNLQSKNSQVQFSGIKFIVTKAGFMTFLSLLEQPTKIDIGFIRNNNPLIKIKFGSVQIYNCSFISTHIQFLIDIEFATNILIKDIFILNSTILFSPLIRLSLRQQFIGNILLININAKNVQQYTNYSDLACLNSTYSTFQSLTCPGGTPSENLIIEYNDTSLEKEQQKLCNQKEVYQQANYNFSLFEIDNLNLNHSFEVQGLHFDSIMCRSCEYGIFRIKDIVQSQIENILFNNINILNCYCGQAGCLSLIQLEDKSLFKNDLLSAKRRILQKHDYTQLIYKLEYQARIVNSKFFNNNAIYGGSVFIVKTNTIIHNCLFQYNKAEIGGAIYQYSNEFSMIMFDSQIIENQAKIAGGLYLNKQQLQETFLLEVFLSNNNATFFGQDIFENPRSLTISIDGGETFLTKIQLKSSPTKIIEKIVVTPYQILGSSEKVKYLTFPSGRQIFSYEFFDIFNSEYIPYNLTFRIIALNKYNTQEKKLAGTTCSLTSTIINTINEETVQGLIGTLSYNEVKFNESTGDYNLDNLIIYFNSSQKNDIVLRLDIYCSIIQTPEYEVTPPYLIKNQITNYHLLVDIKTFQCQLGEFFNATSGGCTLCDVIQGQYSVQEYAQSCSYKDDLKVKSIKSSMIELRESYWRAYYYSKTIEYCYHITENCEGGWSPGDQSCAVGHIGALCEQCDLYNIRGDGSYSISSNYLCGNCDDISGNVFAIISISILTLFSIFMSVSSTVQMIDKYIIGIRLKAFGVAVVVNEISTAILIKIFTNYLQIISTIATFQLQVPSGLIQVINIFSNPITSMSYSLNCFLIHISNIPIIYFTIIWNLIMAFSYLTMFLNLAGLAIVFKFIKYKFSYISTALIYVFIYLQPNLIGGLISQISYRIISDEYWIQGNVAYRYDTDHHVQWLLGFCIPLLLFFGAIIPAYLWYGVKKNQHCLNHSKVRQIWGYLYNEYKLNAYYWETIKIFQKEFIIIVLAYYEDYIQIKASLVFLVLFGYSFLTIAQKPYTSGDLNYLDSKSTVACAVSFILGSSIYTAQQSNLQEIVWPFYIIIGILNVLFTAQMLIKILFAYFVKLSDKIDQIKDFIKRHFPNLIMKHPFLANLLESRKIKLNRIRDRFAKLRTYLLAQATKRLRLKKDKIIIFCNTHESENPGRNSPSQPSWII